MVSLFLICLTRVVAVQPVPLISLQVVCSLLFFPFITGSNVKHFRQFCNKRFNLVRNLQISLIIFTATVAAGAGGREPLISQNFHSYNRTHPTTKRIIIKTSDTKLSYVQTTSDPYCTNTGWHCFMIEISTNDSHIFRGAQAPSLPSC